MTKPFESIRQLFGRMLGGKSAGEDTNALAYSTLGISTPDAQPSMNGNGQPEGFSDESSQPEIDAQTADTQRLPRVAPESLDERNGDASQSRVAQEEGSDEFGDSLLELGDVRGGKAFAADDSILDIFDERAPHDASFVGAIPEVTVPAECATSVSDAFAEDSSAAVAPVFEANQNWATATEAAAVEVVQFESEREATAPAGASSSDFADLSTEAIDAITRRVVAQLSDKVVREIAWEVVPELTELLIKQRLEAR